MGKWLQAFFDATARKPSGWLGRLLYRRPVGHYGFFCVAIDKLQLGPEDVFLEIGCGGGVLLDMVSQTVQRACGIDHSPDMVELAKQKNRRALSKGRVGIIQGDVRALPWAEESFSCAAGVEVLYFIENPQWALEELYRVLKPDGRLVLITAAQPKSRLSQWVFSPWLRYLRFHSNDALASMLKQAGFQSLVVARVNKSEHTAFAHQLVCAVKGADQERNDALNGVASLGVTPGARLSVERNFGHGAIIINLRDTQVALGRGRAIKIPIKRFLEGEDGCQSRGAAEHGW